MASTEFKLGIPSNYQPLKGSERLPTPAAKFLGPSDPDELFSVTIVLRRRPDGPEIPSFDHYAKTPPVSRHRISEDEFVAKYGASDDDMNKVVEFARNHDLKIIETNARRRTIVVSGTTAQMSKAFAVSLGRYQRVTERRLGRNRIPLTETYRGREGAIHVPQDLAGIIVGVFGLDNRSVGYNSLGGDPPLTHMMEIPDILQLYKFPVPGPSISGQTIGIIAPTGGFGGYLQTDLDLTFGCINMPTVHPIDVSIDGVFNGIIQGFTSTLAKQGTNSLYFDGALNIPLGSWGWITGPVVYRVHVLDVEYNPSATRITISIVDFSTMTSSMSLPVDVPAGTLIGFNLDDAMEITQDICIAALAAQGAQIAVYFSKNTQQGWVDLINRAIHPDPGDFPPGVNPPSVLSASWIIAGGDDPAGLASSSITAGCLWAIDAAFQDAALNGITVCVSSGDAGSDGAVGEHDGYSHAFYPASDPWVLSVGGTTLGQYPAGESEPWVEYIWNDDVGATGGGVSDFFPVPSYQSDAGIPDSINKTINTDAPFNPRGRGYPDVAANASPYSGYDPIYNIGFALSGSGTSASAPLWAGLIANINSNLGLNIGFLNPILYSLGSKVFNPINPLWPDPDYPQLADCPPDNGMEGTGIPGYPAQAGWDACTGWGSPDGTALLNAIRIIYRSYTITFLEIGTNKELYPPLKNISDFPIRIIVPDPLVNIYYPIFANCGGNFYYFDELSKIIPNNGDIFNIWFSPKGPLLSDFSIYPFLIGEDLKVDYGDTPPQYEYVARYSLPGEFTDMGQQFVNFNPDDSNFEVVTNTSTTYETSKMSYPQVTATLDDPFHAGKKIFHLVSHEGEGGKILRWTETYDIWRSLDRILLFGEVVKPDNNSLTVLQGKNCLAIAIYNQTCTLLGKGKSSKSIKKRVPQKKSKQGHQIY